MPDGEVDYFNASWLDLVVARLTTRRAGAGAGAVDPVRSMCFDGAMASLDDDPGLPLKLWPCSNGEYLPPPLGPLPREAMRRARAAADSDARRHGWSRRRFLTSAAGLVGGLVALESSAADRARALAIERGGRIAVASRDGR